MSKKPRKNVNIDLEQALEIEAISEGESFTSIVRTLINEALVYRKGSELSAEYVVPLFPSWEEEEIFTVILKGLQELRNRSNMHSSDSKIMRVISNLMAQNAVSNCDLSILAHKLDLSEEQLTSLIYFLERLKE